jgi:hypothetical protein
VRATGARVVYEPEAVAWEEAAPSARLEFRRRARIGAGNFHALRHTWRLLSPTAGMIALAFWSHKVCRWFVPLALAAMQLSALALVRDPFYGAFAVLSGMVGVLALIGHRLDVRARYWAPVSLPYYFVSMNLALLLGLVAFLRGTQSIVWSPTARTVSSPSAEAQ